METVEQFSQNGTLSNQNSLITTMPNYASSADGGVGLTAGFNARQSSQGAFTILELPISTDVNNWDDSSFTQLSTYGLITSQNFANKDEQVNEITVTMAVDPLIGIPEGGVIAGVTEDYSVNNKSSVNVKSALDLAVSNAKTQLKSFTSDEEFLDKMNLAFGDSWHPQEAYALIQGLASGEALPKIEIVPTAKLKANGAFGEGTIYLSEDLLSEKAANTEAVTGVLLEEIGHYIDQKLNSVDSLGDEGNIFARLVQDEVIDADELEELKTEIDTTTIILGGEEIAVEQAAPPYPGYLLKYEPGVPLKYDVHVKEWQQRMHDRGWSIDVDGLYGSQSERIARQFQQEKGLAVDGIVGPQTWKESFRTDNVTSSSAPSPPNPPAPSDPSGNSTQKLLSVAKSYIEPIWDLFKMG